VVQSRSDRQQIGVDRLVRPVLRILEKARFPVSGTTEWFDLYVDLYVDGGYRAW
jgi:hypothetical protein